MLLAAEVGNTNTTFGLFASSGELANAYRLSTERERMPDEWFAMLTALMSADGQQPSEITGAIISSVVPGVTPWLLEMIRQRIGIEAIVVSGQLDVGLRLDVDEPGQLGADRIVDCVAAIDRYGAPAIIVDLGTATTLDVVGRDGAYKGGAIAAGVGTTLKALSANAAQLYNVELRMPDTYIGRNTADQLRIGIVAGHLAMLEGLIVHTRQELGEDAPVVLTGGLARLFVGRSPLFDYYDPDLTLSGLQLIYQRVTSRATEATPA